MAQGGNETNLECLDRGVRFSVGMIGKERRGTRRAQSKIFALRAKILTGRAVWPRIYDIFLCLFLDFFAFFFKKYVILYGRQP